MSTFFFDCFDGESHLIDQHGIELETESEARDQAAELARSLFMDSPAVEDARYVAVTARGSDGMAIYVAHCSFMGRWTAGRAGESPAPDAG